MHTLRHAVVLALFAILGAYFSSGTAAAQSGSYTLASGESTTVTAGAGATNVQVTPSTGSVVVTITYNDGKKTSFNATPASPLNHTRYNSEHEAMPVARIEIIYPTQPPGTHDALGRYKLQ